MKKSRITKLALLGVSTAALVGTLSTSTYAWYVSNKTAAVEGGTGATGAAGSDGSILVSWTAADNTWFKSVDFAGDGDAVKGALQPLHYDTAGDGSNGAGFYGISTNTTTHVTVIGEKNTANYIQFNIYLKAGAACTVTPTMTITTTVQATNNGQLAYTEASYTKVASPADASIGTYYEKGSTGEYTLTTDTAVDDSKTYYTQQSAGLPTSVYAGTASKGQNFTVDAKTALWTQQVVEAKSGVVATGTTSYAPATADTTGGNAHTYYKAVTEDTVTYGVNTSAADDSTAASASSLSSIVFAAAGYTKITYTIFLDGGDVDCFNSCAGWDIAFDLNFAVTA